MCRNKMRRALLFAILCFGIAASAYAAPQIKGLDAKGPAPEMADKLMLFGQFVGNWECDVTEIGQDGSRKTNKCEWNWGWVLGGRAIQDVFIVYPEEAKPGVPLVEHGSTLRVYDARIDAWHIVFADPMRSNLAVLTARKKGDEIVLETGSNNGRVGQWIFSEITKDSFHWRAQGSGDGGKTWHVIQEMNVRRVRASQ